MTNLSMEDILKRDTKTGRFVSSAEPSSDADDAPHPEPVKPEAAPPPVAAPEKPKAEVQPDAQPPSTQSGNPPQAPVTPVVAEPQAVPVPGAEKVETDEVKGLKAALAAEKRKRQQIEARFAQPPANQQPVQRQPAQQQPAAIDPIDDPEAFADNLRNSLREEFTVAQLRDRIGMSEEMAREAFTDFDDVMGTDEDGNKLNWLEACHADPSLMEKFRAARFPAKFAYQELRRQKALADIGDPTAYRDKVRKELEAEIAAKASAAPPAQGAAPAHGSPAAAPPASAAPAQPVPQTLAGTPSKAGRDAPEFSGPTDLKDILNPKRFAKS